MRIAWILLCVLMIVAGCGQRLQHDKQTETEHEDSIIEYEEIITEYEDNISDVQDRVSDYYYSNDTLVVALPGESDDCPDDLVAYGDFCIVA